MLLHLFCPYCAYEKAKGLVGRAEIEVPVPIVSLSDSGVYDVKCLNGHESKVTLENLKFELLFELALNAVIDGYLRDAVASFAGSLERYYEFYYWATLLDKHGDADTVAKSWKPLANASERQLGAFLAAATFVTGEPPEILNTNSEVPFRNRVIHKGYIPTTEESISFGNRILDLVRSGLDDLRNHCPDGLEAAYRYLSPRDYDAVDDDGVEDDIINGCVNMLTTLDVRNPPSKKDIRGGRVEEQFERILQDRVPRRMELLTEDEVRKEYPDFRLPDVTGPKEGS